MKVIDKIGIEFECGISDVDYQDIRNSVKAIPMAIHSDGSVGVDNLDEVNDWRGNAEICFHSGDFLKICEVLTLLHEVAKQNKSCGNHVHLSFKDPTYYRALASHKWFYDAFEGAYSKKYAGHSKYIDRLRSTFCRGKMTESDVITQIGAGYKSSNYRYKMINFNAYREMGTVEFRVLPYMTSAQEHIDALTWLITTVERLLGKKKVSFGRSVEVVSAASYIETKRRVEVCVLH